MKKWEYLTRKERISVIGLDALGGKGWELVSHTAIDQGSGLSQYYVFKRELIEKDQQDEK